MSTQTLQYADTRVEIYSKPAPYRPGHTQITTLHFDGSSCVDVVPDALRDRWVNRMASTYATKP